MLARVYAINGLDSIGDASRAVGILRAAPDSDARARDAMGPARWRFALPGVAHGARTREHISLC